MGGSSSAPRAVPRYRRLDMLLPLLLCVATSGVQAPEIVVDEVLVLAPPGVARREALHTDAVEARIVAGEWSVPRAGDVVVRPDGEELAWEDAQVGEDGWFRHAAFRGGYALATVEVEEAGIWMLEAGGHSLVYVNGVPRTGDPYGYGFVRLPVELRAGVNELLFHCARGRLRAKLARPERESFLDVADATLPDVVDGVDGPLLGAVVAINATGEHQSDLSLRAFVGEREVGAGRAYDLLPLANRKLSFALDARALASLVSETESETLEVELRLQRGDEPLDRATVTLRPRGATEPQKRTFESAIDGSVQYYSVRPALGAPARDGTDPRDPALILSLHGASVEATSQTGAYSSKTWAHVVAPTNRRPYGFDWEDWGRLDALEVLADARTRFASDPQRTYLTGHSMGGHGTWQLGAHFPDRFAALGPSAGWRSFSTYSGVEADASDVFARAGIPSDTPRLFDNYRELGVYVLHGDADDNVPVDEARAVRDWLEEHHDDWRYHEQPGAGHWWDASDEPGADCVDWAPMLDLFARRRIPEPGAVRRVDFTTANPAVSARCHWAEIVAVERAGDTARVQVELDPGLRRFRGTTANVRRLTLSVAHLEPDEALRVELDGQTLGAEEGLAWPADARLHFARSDGAWRATAAAPTAHKGPHRHGPFKDALRNRLLFVVGTRGTPAENAWALAKARYDAETFWYRGNASIDVVLDTEFDPAAEPDRGVLLFGNADTNAAWDALLDFAPVRVERGRVRFADGHVYEGPDKACLFLHPRPGSDVAAVAAIAGTGLPGLRLTERLPYPVSGVAYPDVTVLDLAFLAGGDGVLAAGFLGPDWTLEGAEMTFR